MKKALLLFSFGLWLAMPCAIPQDPSLPGLDKLIRGQNRKSGLVGDYPGRTTYFLNTGGTYEEKWTSEAEYDANGNVLTETITNTDGTAEKYTNAYNSEGLLTQTLKQVRQEGSWVNSERTTNTYDSHNNVTIVLEEQFTDQHWIQVNRRDYSYAYQGDLITRKTTSRYNSGTGQMVPESRNNYTYDAGKLIMEITEAYANGTWANTFRTQYGYPAGGQMVNQMLVDRWQNDAWIQYLKYLLAYSDNNNLEMLMYTWAVSLNDYLLQYRMIEQYDARGNHILDTMEMWLNNIWTLMTGNQYLITYVNNHAVERIHRKFSAGSPAISGVQGWTDYAKYEYSNFFNLGVDDPPVSGLVMNCFPVPSRDRIRIEISSAGSGLKVLELASLSGQVFRNEIVDTVDASITWEISDLPGGIYLLRLTGENNMRIIHKIVKD